MSSATRLGCGIGFVMAQLLLYVRAYFTMDSAFVVYKPGGRERCLQLFYCILK